jgi:hypothetical protein
LSGQKYSDLLPSHSVNALFSSTVMVMLALLLLLLLLLLLHALLHLLLRRRCSGRLRKIVSLLIQNCDWWSGAGNLSLLLNKSAGHNNGCLHGTD